MSPFCRQHFQILLFWFKFHWNLFPMAQSTISHHLFRKWLGAKQAPNHYLNQWWPNSSILTFICVTQPLRFNINTTLTANINQWLIMRLVSLFEIPQFWTHPSTWYHNIITAHVRNQHITQAAWCFHCQPPGAVACFLVAMPLLSASHGTHRNAAWC